LRNLATEHRSFWPNLVGRLTCNVGGVGIQKQKTVDNLDWVPDCSKTALAPLGCFV
jgi:hypothetical protein